MPSKKCCNCGEMFEEVTTDSKPPSTKCPACEPVVFDPMSSFNTPSNEDSRDWDTGWEH